MAHADGALVAVRAVPGASRAKVDGLHGDEVRIRVCSPPVDGRATVSDAPGWGLELRRDRLVLDRPHGG